MTDHGHDEFRELALAVARLERRLIALEDHIIRYGPKVRHSDPSIVGVPQWEAPYRPPEVE